MCGRYSLSAPPELVAELFELEEVPELAPRYNIAPTQAAPVLRLGPGGRRTLETMRWGLPGAGSVPTVINARSETVATKPAFADAFARRRCLVPADGFYEWRREGAVRQPYRVRPAAGGLFAFAGLWDPWPREEDGVQGAFAILTTDAAPAITWLHDRMPVVLAREGFGPWLAGGGPAGLAPLLAPPAAPLAVHAVSTRINSPEPDDPALAEPVPAAQPSLFG
jgi:putative SOS response-associated peptidase YedK